MKQGQQSGPGEQATRQKDNLRKIIEAMDDILLRMANLKLLLKQGEAAETIAPDLLQEAGSILSDFESLFPFWSQAARAQNLPLSTIRGIKKAVDRFERLLAHKDAGIPQPAACHPAQEPTRDH